MGINAIHLKWLKTKTPEHIRVLTDAKLNTVAQLMQESSDEIDLVESQYSSYLEFDWDVADREGDNRKRRVHLLDNDRILENERRLLKALKAYTDCYDEDLDKKTIGGVK